jgi:hypothetical protein
MAENTLNLHFNLRNPSAEGETPINLVVRYNSQKFIYPTSERIFPRFWQGEKGKKGYQKAKTTPSFPIYPECHVLKKPYTF